MSITRDELMAGALASCVCPRRNRGLRIYDLCDAEGLDWYWTVHGDLVRRVRDALAIARDLHKSAEVIDGLLSVYLALGREGKPVMVSDECEVYG